MTLFIKKFLLVVLVSSFLQGSNILDKLYLFGELNHKIQPIQNYGVLNAGVLISKKKYLQNYKSYIKFSGFLKSSEEKNGTSKFIQDIKELYMNIQLNNLQINIGKEVIDLSTSKIYSINNFLSPIVSLLDFYDKSLQITGMYGVSASKKMQNLGVTFSGYLYKKNISNDNEKYISIFNISSKKENIEYDLFWGSNQNDEIFLSSAVAFELQNNISLYMEAKHINDNVDYIVGFSHTMSNGISIAAERMGLSQSTPDLSLSFRDTNNTALPAPIVSQNTNSINGDISKEGGNYANIFIRIPYDLENTISAIGLYNIHSKAFTLISQWEYKYKNTRTITQYIRNINNEFNLESPHIFKINLSVNLLSNQNTIN